MFGETMFHGVMAADEASYCQSVVSETHQSTRLEKRSLVIVCCDQASPGQTTHARTVEEALDVDVTRNRGIGC